MTLLEEIKNGENVALEFKEARPKDSLKFTKTVVAFANGRGGRILFGVEDKTGRLVGIPRDKVAAEMDAIAYTVVNTCTPSVPIDIKPTTLEGKVLIALDVKSGFSKLRNSALGDALEYMKEVEAWGGGVSRYFTACAATGLQPPTVTEEAGFFKVVFWRRGKDAGNVGERQKLNIESSELNIEGSKTNIESSGRTIVVRQEVIQEFSSTTRKNIERVVEKLGGLEYFHRQMVADTLGLKPVASHNLLRKLLAKGIIEPVSGHGKGAYRFV